MMSKWTEWGVTMPSLGFSGATQKGVVSKSHLSFPKIWARSANLCLSRTGNRMDPESTRGRAVPKWEGGELLSAHGLLAVGFWGFFLQGNWGFLHQGEGLKHGLGLSE